MKRDDWFWMGLGVAGLYLLVHAALALLGLVVTVRQWGRTGEFGVLSVGNVVAPALAGWVMLACRKGERGPDTELPADTGGSSMRRADWLWIACKVFGLYLVCVTVGSTLTMIAWGGEELAFLLVAGAVLQVAIGAWLFFGDQLWGWAIRGEPLAAQR